MYLPELPELKNSRRQLRVFGGLNETYGCTEAEYGEGKNFSSRDFPALSTRTPRRKLRALDGADGMYHLNGLVWIRGGSLTYTPDDGSDAVTLTGQLTSGKKALVGIGTKVLIFPDKAAFDTADGTLKPLGADWGGGGAAVEMTPCDAEGNTYTVGSWGAAEPEDPEDGEVFLKVVTESSPWNADGVLEVYSSSLERWTSVTLDHCRISAEGIGADFAVWDTVTVAGTAAAAAGLCDDLDGEKVIYAADEDWLVVRITPGGEHFYGRLLQAAHKTGAEVITTSTSAEWPNKKKIWAGKPGVYQKFADKLAAIRIGSCWNKLYLTDFLRRNELVFPAGLLSEDNLFVIKCLALCKNLGVIDSTRYHYVINPGSLTHAPQIAEKRKKDSLAISCMILEFIRQNVPGARHKIIHFIIKNIISLQYLTDEDYYHTLRQAAGFSPYLIKKRFIALYKFKFRKPRK